MLSKIHLLLFFLMAIVSIGAEPYRMSTPDLSADPVDQALSAIGLTRETCAFPLSGAAVASDKKFESPIYRFLLYRPLEIPYYVGHLVYNFECYRDNFVRTMIFMAARSGASIARGYFTKPLAVLEERLKEAKSPLTLAIEEIYASYGKTLGNDERTSLNLAVKDVPERVRFEAARILITSAEAVRWQRRAFRRAEESDFKSLLENVPERLTPQPLGKNHLPTITEEWERSARYDLRPLIGLIDYRYLFCGALDIINSLDETRATFLQKSVTENFHTRFDTPLGRVVLNGAGENNRYNADVNYVLIMDFGGDDTYTGGGANISPRQPVSIILDFEGNDSYIQTGSALKSAFGAGVGGYGFLLDFDGDDKYVCPQLTQGCGYFGVGWLVDFAGNDTYESTRYGQGYAHCGLGLLYDRGGNDVYYAYTSAQGCGSTRGCGMLIDEGGDDEYIANDDDVRFPSAQSRKHNRSIAQGAGIGERADEEDGHSMPGGVGVLIDRAGDDKYSVGVFAQGMGYWSGVGILADLKGNDNYSGVWYVQGAGIHGGIGVLSDRDGNDTYTATLHASQGMGHDSAIGIFVDEKGDDVYNSPRLALGTGNQSGIGVFFDLAGNDRYYPKSPETLGHTQFSRWGTLREDRLNVGLFLDTGGTDRYESLHGGNNQIWVQEPSKGIRLKSELGVGLDGEFKRVNLRLRPLTKKPPNVEW